ncbi:V-type ATP synthase subunit D [Picrophilus oshimae]|uniref:A-type ATP synthase subunit D n=1 Tax=Picrophilus torridus (strain ATCC 700027 / DSM 9790 / JCM 10055 / NBRC 100828 / KAW 2/3) TaxID=1122961 RepID=A0A8G2FW70_PICTO|nr:V-type ATP synthase subunit D [Picrophilus oshimae]SMD30620.1 V/A-type H+-transporting ATPase subunit D [Picrophilus oshimae DSM 9789]
MANNVKATRIELINTKKRIKVARRGLDLLKMKRQALVMEFMKIANEIKGKREALRNDIAAAINEIKMAEIIEGQMEIERLSYLSSNPDISMNMRNIMGVKIPELDTKYGKTGLTEDYLVSSVPVSVYDSIKLFERVFNELMEISQKEVAMRKLLYEIDKTNRRSNAIENIMIPRMESNLKFIKDHLDELERESFSSLKFVKEHVLDEPQR